MKKWHHRFRPWLTNHLALPSDVIHELPRITIIGQIHAYIENHQGLEVYSNHELKLKTNYGYIQIIGTGFILKMMLPEEMLLEGIITNVKFIPDKLVKGEE